MKIAEVLAALHSASFPHGWSAAEFDALLSNPTNHAITNDHGFALLQIIPPEAELITISVLPAQRGQGHGRALLDETLQTAAQKGATTVFLEVDANNSAAISLYETAGFAQTGRRRAYYTHADGTRSDAITMTLSTAAK